MRAVVYVYHDKMSYVNDKKYTDHRLASYGEDHYSISEALDEVKKEISAIRKSNRDNDRRDFMAFRIYDSLGDLRHSLPSETVTKADEDFYELEFARKHFEEKRRREENNVG